jgi:hypothetical protein
VTPEVIDRLVALARKERPALLEVRDGSGRIFLFSNIDGEYAEIERFVARTGSVSSLESFIAVVKDDLRKPAIELDTKVVYFSRSGGTFLPTPDQPANRFLYYRRDAKPKTILAGLLGKPRAHGEFIRDLQRIREWVVDGTKLLQAYRSVSVDSTTRIESSPILVNGKAGVAIRFDVETRSGLVEASLPSTFSVLISPYEVPVQIDAALSPKGELTFTLVSPEFELIDEKIVADEMAAFRSAFVDTEGNLPVGLLVLESIIG